MVAKKFKFMVLKLLENTVVIKTNDSAYSCPQAKLSPRFLLSLLQAEGNYLFPQNKVF